MAAKQSKAAIQVICFERLLMTQSGRLLIRTVKVNQIDS